MKKLICLILAFAMLCMLGSSLAEELDLDSIEMTISMDPVAIPEIKSKDMSFAMNPNADKVEFGNNVYTVISPDATFVLDLSKGNPYKFCVTQDYFASIEYYSRSENPDEVIQSLIEKKIHFLLLDTETGMTICVLTPGSDQFSARVGDFSSWPEETQKTIQQKKNAEELVKVGDLAWLYFPMGENGRLLTVINGAYVFVDFGGSGDPAGDLEDIKVFLTRLTIS